MPFGMPMRDFVKLFGACTVPFIAGGLVVHFYMRPDLDEPDLQEEVMAQKRALREVKRMADERRRQARAVEGTGG